LAGMSSDCSPGADDEKISEEAFDDFEIMEPI
jgi:hypothetical protein